MTKSRPLSICIIVLVAIFTISSCTTKIDVNPWKVVDENSLLIFESSDGKEDSSVSLFKPFKRPSHGFLLAVQKESKTTLGTIVSFKVNPQEVDSITLALGNKDKAQKITNRTYDGCKIYELPSANKQKTVFTIIDDLVIISSSSFLVENAIRINNSKSNAGFKASNAKLFDFALLKNDAGNVYINFNELSNSISVVPDQFKSIPFFKEWSGKTVFDISKGRDFLVMNGFSLVSDSSLSFFQTQKPVPITIARFIPGYANAVVHFGLSDLKIDADSKTDSSNQKGVQTELAIVNLETSDNMIAIAKLDDDGKAKVKLTSDDYSEEYSAYLIKAVNQRNLKRVYDFLLPTKNFSYCVELEDYLIMTESVEDIKILVDAIENEDTWGKTMDFQSFSERCLQESNISIFARRPNLIPQDEKVGIGLSPLFSNLKLSEATWSSLQFSALDNDFYSSFIIGYSPDDNSVKTNTRSEAKLSNSALNARDAFVVRNLNSQALLIYQSDNAMSMVSPSEGILWRLPLNEELVGNVFQIDYYKNGKLQYLFATKNNIHLVDRLGREVSGFPKNITVNIYQINLVDYDKSKNYRYLIATEKNTLSLLDRDAKNLSEWGPKKVDGLPILPGEHFRAGGKDYFIIILKTGEVQIYSRKGELVNKFNLPRKDFVSGDFFLSAGMNLNSSVLTITDREGTVAQYSLDGKPKSNFNLVRGNKSTFELKRVNGANKFYFIRIDADKLAVFNNDAKLLFEKQNPGSTNFQTQVIEKSSSKTVFSFYDSEQKISYVFDQAGNELLAPFESEIAPVFGQVSSKNTLNLYTFAQNSIVIKVID